jgi:uncharacterized protein (DUF58 family)
MLAAALIVYVFATNSQVIWLYLVAALIGGLAIVGLLAPALAVRRVRPRLHGWSRTGFAAPLAQDRGRLFAGDVLTLNLDLGDDRPPVDIGAVRVGSATAVDVAYRIEQRTASLDLPSARRGMMRVTAVRVTSTWPLGIARARRWTPLDFSVVVHPRYLLPGDDRRRGSKDLVGAAAARGEGDEFLGLREYRSGDSQRRIHWPTSARTGTLMVVETAQESSNSTTYELELEPGSEGAAELAVGIAASLGAANVAAGVAMTMAVPGQQRPLARWAEAVGALALAEPGASSPGRHARDAVRITAISGRVTVARGANATDVDPQMSLEDALEAERETR